MQELFYHWYALLNTLLNTHLHLHLHHCLLLLPLLLARSFEQFGEQTLLLIFCGPKGNGKTLRTERAMKAFVQGWINMSGPSSAKSGMQGVCFTLEPGPCPSNTLGYTLPIPEAMDTT